MKKAAETSKNSTPRYFELLTEEEKGEYLQLKEQLSSSNYKNRRNKSNEVFEDMINSIKQFVIHSDENDWKRSLVCGIIWLHNSIAINTHQLRLLINKCKSSINGSLQALGYETIPTVADSANELITKFPFLRHNFAELRQWTVRQKTSSAPSIKENKISFLQKQDLNEVSPPPDIVYVGNEFSISLNLFNDDSISSHLPFENEISQIDFNEKEQFTKIDDFDISFTKPHNFENDPLIFFPNAEF